MEKGALMAPFSLQKAKVSGALKASFFIFGENLMG